MTRLLTLTQAAERLGFSYQKTRKLVLRGVLPHIDVGGRLHVPETELSAWIAVHTIAAAEPSQAPADVEPDPIAERARQLRAQRLAAKAVRGSFGRRKSSAA